mgnify:CR=1 FL=1
MLHKELIFLVKSPEFQSTTVYDVRSREQPYRGKPVDQDSVPAGVPSVLGGGDNLPHLQVHGRSPFVQVFRIHFDILIQSYCNG